MSLFGRVYASCYDRFMDRIDRDGAAEHPRRLVEEAGGEVLEIGAGTGKNLPFYGAVERVVALEPGGPGLAPTPAPCRNSPTHGAPAIG